MIRNAPMMRSAMPAPREAVRALPRPALAAAHSRQAGAETAPGLAVLGAFTLRWWAGIAENFGIPLASQAAAIAMLALLGLLLLRRMQLATDSALFVAGALAWFAAGSFSIGANTHLDALKTLALLSLLILYALFANAATTYLRSPAHLARIYRLLGGFVLVGAALSIWQLATSHGFIEAAKSARPRAYGSDVHPVSFGIQIVTALTALEIARIRLGRRAGAIHLALMAAGLLALWLTYARTAWVMALFIVAAPLLLQGPLLRRLALGGSGLIAGAFLLATTDRFADLASLPTFLANFSPADAVFDWRFIDNSISWRIVNWAIGFHQALEQPLLGFGPGQSASSSYFSLEMHNIFLETFFEGGIFGFMAFLLLLAGLAHMHRRLPGTTRRDRQSRLLANAFGIALLLAVTFSTSFVDQLMSFLLYMLLLTAAATPLSRPAGR